jgi:hypothetical protein
LKYLSLTIELFLGSLEHPIAGPSGIQRPPRTVVVPSRPPQPPSRPPQPQSRPPRPKFPRADPLQGAKDAWNNYGIIIRFF